MLLRHTHASKYFPSREETRSLPLCHSYLKHVLDATHIALHSNVLPGPRTCTFARTHPTCPPAARNAVTCPETDTSAPAYTVSSCTCDRETLRPAPAPCSMCVLPPLEDYLTHKRMGIREHSCAGAISAWNESRTTSGCGAGRRCAAACGGFVLL